MKRTVISRDEKEIGKVGIQSVGAGVKLGNMNFLTVYNTVK